MQTSLARRQRQRRNGYRNRPKGHAAVAAGAIALPLFLFSTFLIVGFIGFAGAVSAYAYFAQGLDEPKQVLENLTFTQQSKVYDRSGDIELAKLGDDRREVVTFEQIPPELIDATTAIEDKTFWENSGFDPFGFAAAALDTINGNERGGSTITQQLVRARLLPQAAFDGTVYERKVKEIIQSIRLTQAYPGDEGKQKIMAAYLNQNFYGNRSYGVQAAAKTYFGKALKDLTLAQMALLAAIPQSPTKFDLVKNAIEEPYRDDNGVDRSHLVVPDTTEVVARRNYILDLLANDAERRVLSGSLHTTADWQAAKDEPVVLASQASPLWRAPQFVWQVRSELGGILCGKENRDACDKIDTDGYTVITTLDYRMQRIVEKWLFAAARGPNSKSPAAVYRAMKIPTRMYDSSGDWLRQLRNRNIHNAAGAIVDYRTGEVLAYSGSASYTAAGNNKFQPQFDVLEDGWRQPGSSIKPLDYLVGLDDKSMTASTLFIDATTNFAGRGQKAFRPTQADGLERGPVRLRSALQFSLNVPAIKAGFINGLEHQFKRTQEMGIRYAANAGPVISESIGTIEVHPIDMVSAYGAIANGGLLMPRHMIKEIRDRDGKVIWPAPDAKPSKGKRVASAQASYIMTDILAGNTINSVNPYWGEWAIHDGIGGRYRPAAYKTGTTSDNIDVHAYGYLAPPKDKKAPALVAGVWMGNSNNDPNRGSLSLDSSAPLWSAILSEASKGLPISQFKDSKPSGLVSANVDAYTGFKPGGSTTKTFSELFIKGTAPSKSDNLHVVADIDAASGLRWQDGCAGPREVRSFLDLRRAEPDFPQWRSATQSWQNRARGGPGRGTTYFYIGGFRPFGSSWGGRFVPGALCPIAPVGPPPCVSTDPLSPCPTGPAEGTNAPTPSPQPTKTKKP